MRDLLEQALTAGGQSDELGNAAFQWEGIHGSPLEFGYRNKMEFSFGDEYKDGPLSLGLHKKGSTYDILNTGDCKLVHEDMTKILTCVWEHFRDRGLSFYKKNAAYRISASSASTQRCYHRGNSGTCDHHKPGRT